MAPSRAFRLLSLPLTRCLCLNTRQLSISTIQSQRTHQSSALHLSCARWLSYPSTVVRSYSQAASATPEPPDYLNEAELHIFNKVKAELGPVKLEVQDISGGCGSMYAIEIESPKFKGLTVIKQHKLVNEVLKEEIKTWHGVQLRTKATS